LFQKKNENIKFFLYTLKEFNFEESFIHWKKKIYLKIKIKFVFFFEETLTFLINLKIYILKI